MQNEERREKTWKIQKKVLKCDFRQQSFYVEVYSKLTRQGCTESATKATAEVDTPLFKPVELIKSLKFHRLQAMNVFSG